MNPRVLKSRPDQLDRAINKGVGKHILKWSTGSDVVIHVSGSARQITVMENNDERSDHNILRKLLNQ